MSTTVATQDREATRLGEGLSDWWVLTKRNLLTYVRKPDLLVFSTIQPVMFVLLFVFVFGGAIELALPPTIPYVDFLMPGIIIQTAIFTATQTGVGLAEDLTKGLIDRFKSLPMARSAVLAGRTFADSVAIAFQVFLMLFVAFLVGFRFHEGAMEASLAIAGALTVGYAFTWVAAFTGLALKSVEAVQAAMFTIIFPFVFASTAFVPISTFPSWLQGWAQINPVSVWVDTFRVLTLGDVYVQYQISVGYPLPSLGVLLLESTAWFLGFLALFAPLSVRVYRRT
jgi:ABC-2 type transport system permease protein/oleandomycin transport system permease protein